MLPAGRRPQWSACLVGWTLSAPCLCSLVYLLPVGEHMQILKWVQTSATYFGYLSRPAPACVELRASYLVAIRCSLVFCLYSQTCTPFVSQASAATPAVSHGCVPCMSSLRSSANVLLLGGHLQTLKRKHASTAYFGCLVPQIQVHIRPQDSHLDTASYSCVFCLHSQIYPPFAGQGWAQVAIGMDPCSISAA